MCFHSGKFSKRKIPKNFKNPDLILSMLDANESVNFNVMKKIFPKSNRFNTYYSTEYNVYANRSVRLPSGAGSHNLGLLLQKVKKNKKPKSLKNPYLVAYVATDLSGISSCLGRFLNTVLKKYKYKRIDVVIPEALDDEIEESYKSLISRIPPSYGKIILKTKTEEIILADDKGKQTLVFRADILPLPRRKMLGLFEHSLKDILLTGDQSVTDVLSCCTDKVIWYQTAIWKMAFAKAMAKEIPFKAFNTIKSACGSEPYRKPSYKKFINRNDFRIKGKKRLDKIVNYVAEVKKSKELQKFQEVVLHSRSKKKVLDKYC